MADWQANLNQLRIALAEEEAFYAEAVAKLADAASHVREGVLDRARARIEETKGLIATCENQIRLEGREPQ